MARQTFISRNFERIDSADGFLRLDWARDNNINHEPQQYMLGHTVEAALG